MTKHSFEVAEGHGGLKIDSLRKSYSKRLVVRDVSMQLHRGEVVALLGPNGSGKTTCFYSIAGLIAPESGKVSIDGRDVSPYLMGTKQAVAPFEFLYSYSDNKPSALRVGPWKLHIRIGSQRGDNYGFKASEDTPLLFQVEQDISERFDRAPENLDLVRTLREQLLKKEAQLIEEASYWGPILPRKK